MLAQAVEYEHAQVAGQMVIAHPRLAHRRITWPGLDPHGLTTQPVRQAHEALDHARHVMVGDAEVPMPARVLDGHEPGIDEFREMRARGLFGHRRGPSQLAGGHRPPGHETHQDRSPRPVTDEPGNARNAGGLVHSSIIAEPFTPDKSLYVRVS